jgi:formate dehydrogenase subunit gamma
MSTSAERIDESARRRIGPYGRTFVREGELLRHPVYTRVLHWSVAIFFLLALLSGLALYNPWLFRLLTPLFGGGSTTRVLHPWFSLGFVACFGVQFLNWLQ